MAMNFPRDLKHFHGAAVSILVSMLILAVMPSKTNGFSMKLIPRISMEPYLFPRNLSAEEMHHRIVQLSRLRPLQLTHTNLHNHTQEAPKNDLDALQSPIAHGSSNLYVIKVSIGSNPYSPHLLKDSFLDDTWVQCKPCTTCLPLKGGSFEHDTSRTYRVCTCAHPFSAPKICSKANICYYSWMYSGGSITKGVYAVDTLSFPAPRKPTLSFPNVVFGCGIDSINIKFGGQMVLKMRLLAFSVWELEDDQS